MEAIGKMTRLKETSYIVGIDLGYETAVISYIDHMTAKPVIYDVSGGYSIAYMPAMLQYLPSENEWLAGEAAREHYGDEDAIVISNLFDGRDIKLPDGSRVSPKALLKIFLCKIFQSFSALNPNAVIDKAVVSLNVSLYNDFKDSLEEVMAELSVNGSVISSLEGILHFLLFQEELEDGTAIIMDYGFRGLRLYEVNKNGSQVDVSALWNYQDLSGEKLKFNLEKLLMDKFSEVKGISCSDKDRVGIQLLLHQSFPLIFQRYRKNLATKLYYNFTYPPFMTELTYDQVEALLTDLKIIFGQISEDISLKAPYEIFLTGNGFRMLWPMDFFKEDKIFYDPECCAKGCAVYAGIHSHIYHIDKLSLCFPLLKNYFINGKDGEILFSPFDDGVMLIASQDEDNQLRLYSRDIHQNVKLEKTFQLDFTDHYAGFIRVFVRAQLESDGSLDFFAEVLPL